MNDPKRYWFPVKRYGWGWGPPSTWQGWLVLVALLFVLAWAGLVFLPREPVRFVAVTIGSSLAFLLICLLKGEPPSWHWGNSK